MAVSKMVARGIAITLCGATLVASTMNYKGSLADTLESNLNDLETMLQGYSSKYREQKGLIAQYLADIGSKETTITDLNGQITTLNGEIASLRTDKTTLESNLKSVATLLGISTKDKSVDQIMADITNAIGGGTEGGATELDTLKLIAQELGASSEEIGGMTRNQLVAYISSSVATLNDELDKANKEIVRLEGEVDKAQGEINRLKGEIDKANAEIKRLEGIITQYEQDIQGASAKANSVKNAYLDEYNNEIKGEGGTEVSGKGEQEGEQTFTCIECGTDYVGEHTCGDTPIVGGNGVDEPTIEGEEATISSTEYRLASLMYGRYGASDVSSIGFRLNDSGKYECTSGDFASAIKLNASSVGANADGTFNSEPSMANILSVYNKLVSGEMTSDEVWALGNK